MCLILKGVKRTIVTAKANDVFASTRHPKIGRTNFGGILPRSARVIKQKKL
jgi:hypothetical protein